MAKSTTTPLLTWSSEAEGDVAKIIDYISDQNPRAAHKVLDLIEEKVKGLPLHPKLYRAGRVDGTREMVITPSYLAVYKEDPEEVRILRVLHTAQMWPE